MPAFYALTGVHAPFDPENRLVTSWVVPPLLHGLLRLLLGLYALVTAIVVLAYNTGDSFTGTPNTYFSYFTNLSYLGIVSYFLAAAVQTLAFAIGRRQGYPLQRWPRFLQFLHLLLMSTVFVFPYVVLIVIWAILYTPATFWATKYTAWSNISCHAMNAVFAFCEAIFTNVPPMPWLYLPFIILLIALYLGVAYISHATQGFYVYDFLDPSTQHGLVAGYVFGIGIGCALLFTVVRYIIVLRVWSVARAGRGDGDKQSYPPVEKMTEGGASVEEV